MRIIVPMSDDRKPKPLDDVSEGLGLLFRAAKTVTQSTVERLEKLPSDNLENFVTEGVKEVGRVLESVGNVIEREVMGTKAPAKPEGDGKPANAAGSATASAKDAASANDTGATAASATPDPSPGASGAADKPNDEPPKGPRIA